MQAVAGSNPATATFLSRSHSIVGMHFSDKEKIAGSIPAVSICQCNSMVEYLPCKQKVAGSSPASGFL